MARVSAFLCGAGVQTPHVNVCVNVGLAMYTRDYVQGNREIHGPIWFIYTRFRITLRICVCFLFNICSLSWPGRHLVEMPVQKNKAVQAVGIKRLLILMLPTFICNPFFF
jgi:hypothetical protein